MNAPLPDPFAISAQCRQRLDQRFPHNPKARDQAALVTQVLQELGMRSALYACQIHEGHNDLQVVDQAGRPRPAWATVLLSAITASELPDSLTAPPGLGLSGQQRLLLEPLAPNGRSVGFVMLALPEGGDEAAARGILAACAAHVALHLALHAQELRVQQLSGELARQARLADLGELGSPLAHEFNNFLNTLVLQAAVLEQQLPENLRPELAKVRQQANRVAALVKQLQNYRRGLPPAPVPVDVNRIAAAALQTVRQRVGEEAGKHTVAALAPDLPAVECDELDLLRLCTFLIGNAVRAAAGGRVVVRTESAGQHVRLIVEDAGPAVAPDALHDVFELGLKGRPGTESLELAACRSIARRLRGQVHAANRAAGGLTITVELSAAS